MPSSFSFMTPTKILFGRGQAGHAAERIAPWGKRVLLVHGAARCRSEWLAEDLTRGGSTVTRFVVPHEPDMALIEVGARAAREVGAEVVAVV
jgi:alcohol dehydrogenase YqhD (iron-dependent ADH family)